MSGSAAAEISLLLRRVMQAFEVEPGAVRFVATSATIGDPDDPRTPEQLQAYLADLAGVARERVHVVLGARQQVVLPPADAADPADWDHATALARRPSVQRLVREAEAGPLSLRRVEEHARACGTSAERLVGAVAGAGGDGADRLLPMRVHKFVRAVPGLWSCLNPHCPGDKPEGWPYGGLLHERQEACPRCTAPVFELLNCRECGEPWLDALDNGERLTPRRTAADADEFAAHTARDLGTDADADLDIDEVPDGAEGVAASPGRRRLLAVRPFPGAGLIAVDPLTGVLPERRDAGLPVPAGPAADDGACPRCRATPPKTGSGPLWPFRFGAPFLVQNAAPILLEGVSPAAASGERALPADGRQLLSFTDSRQGAARFAANLETLSERGFVRAFIHHSTQKAAAPRVPDPERRAKLVEEIDALRSAAKAYPVLREQLAMSEAELAGVGGAPVAWTKLKLALAADPMLEQWIREVWHERDPRLGKHAPGGCETLAEMLLLRELNRRPRRANAVETLGLARLVAPVLERLGDASTPGEFRQRNLDPGAWRDFLYFLLDSVVRTNFALAISRDDARWFLPRKAFLRTIVPPGDPKEKPSDVAWPRARGDAVKSDAVRLLEHALQLDAASAEDRSRLNDVLAGAWNALRPLLEGAGSTYALAFERLEVGAVKEAWLCPVTHKVLPRLVFGRTPYGLRHRAPGFDAAPEPLSFPALAATFPQRRAERDAVAAFVDSSPEVKVLRARGVWGALHDRAAVFAPYMRAEEHSAQQPPARLRTFEAEFRAGEINLLACSTTMEMGVDIGSVEVVLNTNVPPAVTNYRQRIGRAGRRGQSFSSSLTFARDTPLDREAFRDPVEYLKRASQVPTVKLDSERIVERHAHALLLAQWFRDAKGQITRTKAGEFFGAILPGAREAETGAPVAAFVGWLEAPSTAAAMQARLAALVAGTALAGRTDVMRRAGQAFAAAASAFQAQWAALAGQLEGLAPEAQASVDRQMRRIWGEPLLKELANRSLLPGHGFPTAVTPFITDSRAMRGRDRETEEEQRETDRSRRYDYASRNADIAIREYAPGAEVVIDGLVWTSAGVTLNWRRPAHEAEARDLQSLRHHWRCRDCGGTGCGPLRAERCEDCGSERLEQQRFLEPAGFRVDWSTPPHADTDGARFIEPEPPRVSAGGADWRPLLDPALGRCRAATNGRVFHLSRGAARGGYRVCLECGRADEADSGLLADHYALMPRKGGAGRCPGNDRTYAITEPMALGHEVATDVAELQPAALESAGASWALASALREALARKLGIETRELGLSADPRPGPLGRGTHSIYLFDQASGGAGYAPRLLEALPDMLGEARGRLDCPARCERGCSACVLAPDLHARAEILDRKAALLAVDVLLTRLAAPDQDDMAAPDARLSAPVADALARDMRPGGDVTLFAPGGLDLSSLREPPFSALFDAARRTGCGVRLALPASVLDELDEASRRGLRNASHRHGVTLFTGQAAVAPNGAALLATATVEGGRIGLWTRDASAQRFDGAWGVAVEHPVVCAPATEPSLRPVPEDALERALPAGARVLLLDNSPGRPCRLFGTALVRNQLQPELEAMGLWLPGQLTRLEYTDRYLKAPLPTLLMIRVLAALRQDLSPLGAPPPAVAVTTEPLKLDAYGRCPARLGHDWTDEDDRAGVVGEMARLAGLDLRFTVAAAPHSRKLTIGYGDGRSAVVFLDQGFGYWRSASNDRHDFHARPARQAAALLDAATLVSGQGESYLALVGR